MRFGEPHWLWLLVLVPALALFMIWAIRRRARDLRRWCGPELWERMMPGRDRWAPWWKGFLILWAVFFLALTAARPQLGSRVLSVERKGVDVMVALDLSESMLAEDLPPNRLTRAQQGVQSLIEHLRGDRVGLVGFAGEAFVECPLTLDYAAARMFLRLMNTDLIPVPGTAIAEAIRTATKAFDPKQRKYKALVLITDGEDHEGNIDAAVKEAKEQGVRIFAVGLGSEKGEPIPERDASGQVHDYKRDQRGTVVMTRLDTAPLRKICEDTGGRYYDGNAGGLALDRLYDEISGMEQKEQKGGIVTQYEDRYGYFAAAALVLLAIELLLGERRGRPRERKNGRNRGARLAPGAAAWLVAGLLGSGLLADALSPCAAQANDRGGREYKKKNYAAARDAYEAYARQHPDDPRGEYNLGTALHRTGEMPPAEQSLERAARSSDPKLRNAAFYNLGNTRVKGGDFKGAAEAYEMALRAKPDDKDAKYNLELVRALMQQQPPDSSKQNRPNQQNQQQKKNQDKNQQKQNQEQNTPDQQKQDQQKQDQQKQDQQKQDQQEQEQQQNQQQNQQHQDQQKQGDQQPDQAQQADQDQQQDRQNQAQGAPLKISPEQARRILEGLQQQEMQLQQERLRARSTKVRVEKDW